MRSPLRATFAALALTLAAPACEKGDSSTNPDSAGPADALSDVEDGKTRLKYASEGFTLLSTIEEKNSVSGGASGSRLVKADGTIVATPIEGGKLRVEATNGDAIEYVAEGAFDQEPEEGEEKIDFATKLKGAKSWLVIDRLGEVDVDATKAIPENVERKKAADERKAKDDDDLAVDDLDFSSVLSMPSLPTTGLIEGEKTTLPTKEDEFETGGGDMPVEIDQTYTLKSLVTEGEDQIATVDIEIVTSGAAELETGQGSAFVAFDAETFGTLVFNVTKGIPVKWTAENLTEFHVGEKTYEQNQETKATFALQ